MPEKEIIPFKELNRTEKLDLIDKAAKILALTPEVNPQNNNELLERVISFVELLYNRFPIYKGHSAIAPVIGP
jgi:hypothetical protein